MALNPPQNSSGDPLRVEGEYFVMKRKGVEFEFNLESGSKYTGKGYVILINPDDPYHCKASMC